MEKKIMKSKETKKRSSFIIYFLLLVLVLSGCGDPHRYRTTRYYTPDWSPDGTHIACIEEIYEFDRIDNYGMFDPHGPYNESYRRKLLIYDLTKNDSKTYDYGGYYPYDLDWYPGTDILLSDGSENLKILRMSGNQYVTTDSMKIADSKGILRARWNYDHSLIAVGFREDTAIWIVDSNGSFIESLQSYVTDLFVFNESKNLLFFIYNASIPKNETYFKLYDFNKKEITTHTTLEKNTHGIVGDWLSDAEILFEDGAVLNLNDSSVYQLIPSIKEIGKNLSPLQFDSNKIRISGIYGYYNVKILNIQTQEERTIINSIYEQRID